MGLGFPLTQVQLSGIDVDMTVQTVSTSDPGENFWILRGLNRPGPRIPYSGVSRRLGYSAVVNWSIEIGSRSIQYRGVVMYPKASLQEYQQLEWRDPAGSTCECTDKSPDTPLLKNGQRLHYVFRRGFDLGQTAPPGVLVVR